MLSINLIGRDLAIDLGTVNTLVYMRGRGIILREPSVVAVKTGARREVVAVGEDARDMIGRTPGNIVAIRPLREGVIADYDITEVMLRYFIRKASPRTSSILNPRVVLCAPCGITEVERRALEEAARNAGAREALLMEEPMAAAIGAGLDVYAPCGCMIVDIGGGTTEVAVLSLGGIVSSRSLRIGGNHLDETIVEYIRREYNMSIGERTAEEIKIRIGSVYPVTEERTLEVRGRDLSGGLPCSVTINSKEIRHALREPVSQIVAALRLTLEQTPPELSADIIQSGITLSGGTSSLTGLCQLLQVETGMSVRIAQNPLDCVVTGASMVVDGMYNSRHPMQRLRMESI
jgi:rod shape-determining protein MreB